VKAIVSRSYGSPDVFSLEEVAKPTVTEEGMLVRVHATSINALDWHLLRGKPYLARATEGWRRPKTNVLGVDVAGIVEEVGANVTHVRPGDAVFGSRTGAFAEFVSGRVLVPMPANLTFEQAAAVPVAGQTALQGLRDKGGLRAGQHVLVDGAGGGVGTFAVQIAKAFGAEVTAVTNAQSLDVVRSIGADHVVDYGQEDYTRGGARYDLIFDIGGRHSIADVRRALAPDGTAVLVGPGPGDWIGPITRVVGAALTSRFNRKQVRPFLSNANRDDLLVLKELIEAGKVTPVVDRTFGLEDVASAVRYVEAGRVRGKVVIRVAPETDQGQ
jgi:NADPH:quinone reductase-like Zn-dependent oxidoreductase